MSIRVIPVGTKIRTVIGKIEALITGVCIRDQYISYSIGYFIDGKYETAWLYRYEFNVDAAVPKKPGLVNYDPPETEDDHTILLGPMSPSPA